MPERPPRGNAVPAAEVGAMFDRIAPIYDAMNTFLTLGLDRRWRRAAVAAAWLAPGGSAVDVACGSGALTRMLAHAVGTAGSATGVDLSEPMLERARKRRTDPQSATPAYVRADALDLPMADASADAVTIAFGLRNVADYEQALSEMLRVCRPGGRVVVLEISNPTSRLGRLLAATWFDRAVPLLGRLAGGGSAYRYLPSSVRGYPSPKRVADLMRGAGASSVTWRRLWPGLVTLHAGRRP